VGDPIKITFKASLDAGSPCKLSGDGRTEANVGALFGPNLAVTCDLTFDQRDRDQLEKAGRTPSGQRRMGLASAFGGMGDIRTAGPIPYPMSAWHLMCEPASAAALRARSLRTFSLHFALPGHCKVWPSATACGRFGLYNGLSQEPLPRTIRRMIVACHQRKFSAKIFHATRTARFVTPSTMVVLCTHAQ
jgi:hypothetical protein